MPTAVTFPDYEPHDWSQYDTSQLIADIDKYKAVIDKKSEIIKKNFEELQEKYPGIYLPDMTVSSNKRDAIVTTSTDLIATIKLANSRKRSPFTKQFILNDLVDKEALVTFEGGQTSEEEDYPGCISYDSSCAKLVQGDVEMMKDIAIKGGTGLMFPDKFQHSEDILLAAGLVEDFDGYSSSWCLENN